MGNTYYKDLEFTYYIPEVSEKLVVGYVNRLAKLLELRKVKTTFSRDDCCKMLCLQVVRKQTNAQVFPYSFEVHKDGNCNEEWEVNLYPTKIAHFEIGIRNGLRRRETMPREFIDSLIDSQIANVVLFSSMNCLKWLGYSGFRLNE